MASITKIGGRWRAQIRRAGRKSISKTFPTKAAAQAWADDIERGADRPTLVTIAALIQTYRQARIDSGRPIPKTANEHYMLKRIEDMLGHLRLLDLDTPDLVGFCQKRRAAGAGLYACFMDVSKLRTIIKHTKSLLGLKLGDPVGDALPTLHHFRLVGPGGKRRRRPSADELRRMFEWYSQHPEIGPPMADIIRVACNAILRRGELCRITRADLDPVRRGVMVRDRKHPRKKEGNDIFVPLFGDAWDICLRQPAKAGDDRIFPFEVGTVSKYFRKACKELGIENLHLHDCKREATSALAEAGLTPQEVTAAGGPKKWEVQAIYTEIDAGSLHDKVVPIRRKTG